MYCAFMRPAGRKQYGAHDNLVPVKAVLPHEQKSFKPLVALLEVWQDQNEIFGMPKVDSTHPVRWCSPLSFLCWK